MIYAELLKAEQAISPERNMLPLRDAVNQILAAAEDNAQDDEGRFESIRCMLCYPDPDWPADVAAWFRAQGIDW
jgi:hypothetical protein